MVLTSKNVSLTKARKGWFLTIKDTTVRAGVPPIENTWAITDDEIHHLANVVAQAEQEISERPQQPEEGQQAIL